MAITVGTDTYISLADADTYMAENYTSGSTEFTTWDALSDADKEIYLKKATKRIDRQRLRGVRAVETQTLEFPRAIYSRTYRNEIPNLSVRLSGDWIIETAVSDYVKDAQCEEALSMSVDGDTISKREKMQQQGVKGFGIGDLSETYVVKSVTDNSTKMISNVARELLSYYTSGGRRIC